MGGGNTPTCPVHPTPKQVNLQYKRELSCGLDAKAVPSTDCLVRALASRGLGQGQRAAGVGADK